MTDEHKQKQKRKDDRMKKLEVYPKGSSLVAVYGGHRLEITIEFITPEIATQYLELNVNRNESPAYFKTLAFDMRASEFYFTHQGIAFDEHGRLRDGQTRLRAIEVSGVGQPMIVARGLSDKACAAIDNGRGRTLTDYTKITTGAVLPKQYQSALCGMFVGSRYSHDGHNRGRLTVITVARLAAIYDSAVRFALEAFPKSPDTPKGIRVGEILGVIARAYYTQDKDKLAHFGRVMATGQSDGDADSAAIKLRNWRIQSIAANHSEIYWKAEQALNAFLLGRPLGRLTLADEEFFPVPTCQESEVAEGELVTVSA